MIAVCLFPGASPSAITSSSLRMSATEGCISNKKSKTGAAPRGRCSASFYVFMTLIDSLGVYLKEVSSVLHKFWKNKNLRWQ